MFARFCLSTVCRIAGMVALSLLMLAVSGAALAEPVRLGILSPRPSAEAQVRWAPLAEALGQAINDRDVVVEVFDLADLERAVATRRLDFVLTSPGHYLFLARRYGLSAPLATRVSRYRGQDLAVVGGLIVVRADNPDIRSLADLTDRRIAMVSLVAMGGYQMQAHELYLRGLPLPKPENLVQLGTPHDRVIEAVLSGQADAGFLRAGRLEELIQAGKLAPDGLRVINPQPMPDLPFQVSTRLYPEWLMASLPHIDPELARTLTIAALGLRDQPELLEKIGFGGFRIPMDYVVVEDMLRDLRTPPFDTRVEVTLTDFLRQYRLETLATLFVFVALLALAMLLAFSRARLKRLQRIIEFSPIAAISWRNEEGWPVQYVTDNIRMLGYRPEELSSGKLRYDELLHPDDATRVANEVTDHLTDGPDEYQQLYRLRHAAGHWVWVQDHTWLTRNRQGQVTGIHGVLLDVTQRQDAEQKVRETRHLLRYIVEHARYAVAVHDRDLNFVYVSQKYLEIFKLSGQKVIGRHHYEVFPELPQHLRDVHQRVLQGEVLSADEDPFIYPDGSMDWTRWECRPWFEGDGTIGGLIVYTEIITDRKQAELDLKEKTEALAQSNARLEQLAAVFTHAREGVIITDLIGNIVEVNEAFSRITGYDREEVLGRNPSLLRSGRHGPSFYRDMWNALKVRGYWSGEIWNRRKSGELYPQHLTISAVTDVQGQAVQYVSLFSDVSDIKHHERQIEYASQYDALTGLPNRHLLTDRLKEAMAQMQRIESGLVLIYLDLDDFKEINETCGHDVGDALLRQLAERVQRALKAGDVVGRLGGDELVIALLDLASQDEIESRLELLLGLVESAFVVGGTKLDVSASLGVTLFPQPDRIDADQLMRQADQAMYRAKVESRGRYQFFDREQDLAARGLHESRQQIRLGLENDEFELFYQPKVNMRTGEIVGAEALIRWQHPERGLLAPGQFLPLIENDDLALAMGDWVINRALAQLGEWNHQGLDLEVSVNVFARQLQEEGFVAGLRAALARHPEVRPEQFGIEVLETSALADISKVSNIIDQCWALGVKSALDDFGTGYSSLSYLKGLPAAVLKIDQSFVRDMLDDPEDLAILKGVLGLASAFGRVPIAEGVETLRHGELLLDLGCDLGQGYGIARPMPAGAFPDWMASWQPGESWRNRPAKNDVQLRLIFAMVEHRAWIAAVADCLDSGQRPPELAIESCALGRWMREHDDSLRLTLEELEQFEGLHAEVHRVALELFEQQEDTEASRDRLFVMRDRLLDCLEAIEQSMPSRMAGQTAGS